MKTGQAMLAIDNQKAGLRVFEVADGFKLAEWAELQYFVRKEQHASRNRGLCFGGFVEVNDLANFLSAQQPLKCLLAFLHFADELRDWIIHIGISFNGLAFEVKPAGETNAMENVLRFERDEIKDAVFLAYACGKHRNYLTRQRHQ